MPVAMRFAVLAPLLTYLLFYPVAASYYAQPLSIQPVNLLPAGPLWRIGGSAEAVDVAGGYAYLVQGSQLRVISLATGLPVGMLSFDYPLRDIVVRAEYAYVVTGSGGELHVVDVSDPSKPTLVGTGSLRAGGECLTLNWPYVFVLSNWPDEMLVVFDVTQASAPEKKTTMTLSQYGKRARMGQDYLYVVSHLGKVGVIDIRNPLSPVEKGWLALGAENLAVAEPYVYVTGSVDAWPGVYLVDASDPALPEVVGEWSYPFTGSTLGIAVMDHFLYVGYNSNGFSPSHAIHILDITDPTHPERAAVYAAASSLYQFLIQGQVMYIAGGPDGDLRSLDLADPLAPQPMIELNQPGFVQQVQVVGSRVYLSARSDYYGVRSGIWIYDLSDPLQPVTVDFEDPLGSLYDFVVVEPYLYVAGQSHLTIRNINQLGIPLGFYSHDQGALTSVAVKGNVAYAVVLYQDLYFFNIADRANPVLEGSMPLADDGLEHVVTAGNRLYVVERLERFYLLDIAVPQVPKLVTQYDLPGLEVLAAEGDRVYAGTKAYAGTSNGLTVLDVSDPGQIAKTGSFETLNAVRGISAAEQAVYLSGFGFAHRIDAGAATGPSARWSFNGLAEGADIAALGLYALLADAQLGLALHATADGAIHPGSGSPSAVDLEDPLVVTFARTMDPASVTFLCMPDPGGWQADWDTSQRVLTLRHSPFIHGQAYDFRITGGETTDGDAITPFGLVFTAAERRKVFLPLVRDGP